MCGVPMLRILAAEPAASSICCSGLVLNMSRPLSHPRRLMYCETASRIAQTAFLAIIFLGEHVEELGPFDLVVSIGVLHHIPEPAPVVAAAYRALRPGGQLFAWLYAKEDNRLYLALVLPLRAVTKRLPDRMLDVVVRVLDLPLVAYIALCRSLPLPMRDYMRNVVGRMAPDKRRLIIFDQLNPGYAKYYTRAEAEALFATAGFSNIQLHNRHGYSWSVVGRKS